MSIYLLNYIHRLNKVHSRNNRTRYIIYLSKIEHIFNIIPCSKLLIMWIYKRNPTFLQEPKWRRIRTIFKLSHYVVIQMESCINSIYFFFWIHLLSQIPKFLKIYIYNVLRYFYSSELMDDKMYNIKSIL